LRSFRKAMGALRDTRGQGARRRQSHP
jgi:hypothetical protein